jgi:hypothetical protein
MSRTQVHDATAKFRVSQKILNNLTEKAARNGMTLPEILRAAARRELEGFVSTESE